LSLYRSADVPARSLGDFAGTFGAESAVICFPLDFLVAETKSFRMPRAGFAFSGRVFIQWIGAKDGAMGGSGIIRLAGWV
jgi:hypothetical protein